ncbi:MAG TPA: glycosyltransferase family 4 protein [Chloroflexota bacterium]|nr:glycosyltransferase family 4 protein [Chloroflexota bacterium]HUM68194.1 glycosyltransferase family 4 protein [Chloroflexota bacterium]
MMNACKPRIVGALVGDVHHDPAAQIKYGFFFAALAEHFPLVEIFDVGLYGIHRYLNALQTFHPDRQRWRENFYKNLTAFRWRSRLASSYFQSVHKEIDLIVQVGVLFDARWQTGSLPSLIYTDYTAHLAAQRPSAGRSPFSAAQRQEWLALERAAFARASHICTRSELVRDSIIQEYGMAPEKVTAVGGGVNFVRLPQLVQRWETSTPTILFIGKEFHRKGGDLLLEAFAQARQEVPGARLKMVTAVPIPSAIPDTGVEVIRATWDRQTIAALYRSADLFVLPSRLETWGDVLLEAMSYGLPCIGVTGQAMEEIIDHESTGLIVPAEDVAMLAQSLVRLLKDAGLRRRMGRQARLKVEANFQWSDVVQRLGDCIQQIMEHDGQKWTAGC